MRRIFALVVFFLFAQSVQAQETKYNQKDEKGRPHGQWIVNQPSRMGEDAYVEWGTYDHGEKWGLWYRFDDNEHVTAIERFKAGVLDGEAQYFENGQLVCVGHYRGLNPRQKYDTIYVVDPVTDVETRRILPTVSGTLKHGLWRYYDPQSGRLIREIDYQLGDAIASQDFSVAPVDSAWYKAREKSLPHNQKHIYKPPKSKQTHYTDFD
jgi:antitoxin component YwqK of YwqJK toxin-antitoxin module